MGRKKLLPDSGMDDDFHFEAKAEKIEWNNISENYEMETLYEIENNSELIRIEMNTIEFPLFTKNKRIGNNTIMTYEFNHMKNQFLKIMPKAGSRIPGEFEERIFFALMKLYKKNGHNQTVYTDFYTIIGEMRLDYSGTTLRKLKAGLKNLGGTNYEFNNLFYSNELHGVINDNILTTMFSIRIIELKEAKKVTNPDMLKAFRNSKIKEIVEIRFSGHFYDNVIKKGYLYFDKQDLLQIENPVSRTLFMMLTKWRNKDLYIKRYSKFLASRIPLSWKKTNIPGTLNLLKEAFENLKTKGVIKDYKFNSENGGANSYFEIWFDKVHNKNYLQFNFNSENPTPVIEHSSYEITNQIRENAVQEMEDYPIVESEITMQSRELQKLLPEKAQSLKTLEGKIEKALKKYGYEYTKGAVLYTAENAKKSFGKYLDGTLTENWHEEFTAKIKAEKEAEIKESAKREKKKAEISEKELQEQKVAGEKEIIREKIMKLPESEKENIEKIVYERYMEKAPAGGQARKFMETTFEKAKLSLMEDYVRETDYFKNSSVIESPAEEKKSLEKSEPAEKNKVENPVVTEEKKQEISLDRKRISKLIQEASGNFALIYGLDEMEELNLKVQVAEKIKMLEQINEENILKIFDETIKSWK